MGCGFGVKNVNVLSPGPDGLAAEEVRIADGNAEPARDAVMRYHERAAQRRQCQRRHQVIDLERQINLMNRPIEFISRNSKVGRSFDPSIRPSIRPSVR